MIKWQHKFFCCRECCMKRTPNSIEKFINLKASEALIRQKLDLNNFIQDSLEFNCIRHIIMKSRHKILAPFLTLNLLIHKKKVITHKSSFFRNIHERTDKPLFTISDAIEEIIKNNNDTNTERNYIEETMDQFFYDYLPKDSVEECKANLNNKTHKLGVNPENRSVNDIESSNKNILKGNKPILFRNKTTIEMGKTNKINPIDSEIDQFSKKIDSKRASVKQMNELGPQLVMSNSALGNINTFEIETNKSTRLNKSINPNQTFRS